MALLDNVKAYALNIVDLIDNGDLESFETYGKIGDLIEKLRYTRIQVVKYFFNKKENNNEK